MPTTLIFDIGKTNKKLFLFDEHYNIIHEESTSFQETKDEDGFPCEDLSALTKWVSEKSQQFFSNQKYNIRAVNFSAYGASFVHLDGSNKPLTPLYNYLKPYPEKLKQQFYNSYGDENTIARQTASPVLGSLNSGMQLYRLKYEQPEIFSRLKCSLHLPQYISFIISSQKTSDITSIGCHTQLWDFQKNDYHHWVYAEDIHGRLAPILRETSLTLTNMRNMAIGIGLHDSSAALIPYLALHPEPFVLISTGTWCISLNPFNGSMLTEQELHNDCLCYLSYHGKPVKASRLFAGYEHEEQVKRLAAHFNKNVNYYKTVNYDDMLLKKMQKNNTEKLSSGRAMMQKSAFTKRSLHDFVTYEEAYHQLMLDIIAQQVFSTKLVLHNAPVKQIFVDGGFSSNDIYMNLLASSFPDIKIYAAGVPQASALGAALVLHEHINKENISPGLIELKHYTVKGNMVI